MRTPHETIPRLTDRATSPGRDNMPRSARAGDGPKSFQKSAYTGLDVDANIGSTHA
jgi:hypothetical protein